MILASGDIETTGLSPEDHMILEVGVVLWDTTDFATPVEQLPTFHCYVTRERPIIGDAFALSMHPTILRRIANREIGYNYVDATGVAYHLNKFMSSAAPGSIDASGRAKLCFAGKNFGTFDLQFLRRLSNWSSFIRVMHRMIDPGTLYFDPAKDVVVPSTDLCVQRANLRRLVPISTEITHTAVEDARLVIELLRTVRQSAAKVRNVVCSYQPKDDGTAFVMFQEHVPNVASVLEINFGGSTNERFTLMPIGDDLVHYTFRIKMDYHAPSEFVGKPVFIERS